MSRIFLHQFNNYFILRRINSGEAVKKYTPAQWIIARLGGIRPAARALHKTPGAVAFWLRPARNKGTAGRIPGKNHEAILRLAKRRNLDITGLDLIQGRTTRGRK